MLSKLVGYLRLSWKKSTNNRGSSSCQRAVNARVFKWETLICHNALGGLVIKDLRKSKVALEGKKIMELLNGHSSA